MRYLILVVRTAFSHSLTVAQDILFALLLFLGFLVWVAPRFNMTAVATADVVPWMSALNGWTVTAAIFGSIICIRLLLAPYWIWKEQNEKIASLQNIQKALIQLDGPTLFQDSTGRQNGWRIKVRNLGAVAARHVHLRLVDITPRPRYGPWDADYPYPIPVFGLTIDSGECLINPDDAETFELFKGWKSAGGEFYTSLDTRTGGNPIRLEKDERWHLQYEISAENTERIQFSANALIENDQVVLR